MISPTPFRRRIRPIRTLAVHLAYMSALLATALVPLGPGGDDSVGALPTGTFKAEYFNNTKLRDQPVLVQDEAAVDHDWGEGRPAGNVRKNWFSARWSRTVSLVEGRYHIGITSDDGMRVFVDGVLVIDEWRVQSAAAYEVDIDLAAGNHRIVIEYYEKTGRAVAKFSMTGPTVSGDTTTTTTSTTTTTTAPEATTNEPTETTDSNQTDTSTSAARRLGLHVTIEELALWRGRAATGPYKQSADAVANSPGDWSRIVSDADRYLSKPSSFEWMGPTYNYPNAVEPQGWCTTTPDCYPGQKDGGYSAEPLRDAAFRAMVLGATQVPGATMSASERDAALTKVKASLQRMIRSQYLDFTNRQRWDPAADLGKGFGPTYRINRWFIQVIHAYDYAQIANPALWTSAEKAEFVSWVAALADWWMAATDARRSGMYNYDTWDSPHTGVTSAGQQVQSGKRIWHGGPEVQKVHLRMDNHVSAQVRGPVWAGLLAQLERSRSGVVTLSDARIGELLAFGKRMVRDYLVSEFIAAAPGTGGGVRSASGNFYRGLSDTPPLDGWKYSMEHLGHVLTIADHLARAGDTWAFTYSTTDGTSLSGGTVPNDGVTSGGPKTLLAATKQMLSFIDEASGPTRYGSASNTTMDYRIDSRDEVHGILRANEWELLAAQVFFQDPYVKSVYMRARPGTPTLPANPRNAQHRVENGDFGAFPGVNFMFAQVESRIWPYPVPPPS